MERKKNIRHFRDLEVYRRARMDEHIGMDDLQGWMGAWLDEVKSFGNTMLDWVFFSVPVY